MVVFVVAAWRAKQYLPIYDVNIFPRGGATVVIRDNSRQTVK
jgi:hypothetical protein